MIYTLIFKPGFRNTLRTLAFVILVAFSATLYSCQTVYTENDTPDKLKTDEDVTILEVTTKNDSVINLAGYDVTYFEKYKDSSNILLLEKADTNIIKIEPQKEYKITKKLSEINLKDISYMKVEKSKFSWVKTTILVGVILVAVVIIGIIAISSAWANSGSWFYWGNAGH